MINSIRSRVKFLGGILTLLCLGVALCDLSIDKLKHSYNASSHEFPVIDDLIKTSKAIPNNLDIGYWVSDITKIDGLDRATLAALSFQRLPMRVHPLDSVSDAKTDYIVISRFAAALDDLEHRNPTYHIIRSTSAFHILRRDGAQEDVHRAVYLQSSQSSLFRQIATMATISLCLTLFFPLGIRQTICGNREAYTDFCLICECHFFVLAFFLATSTKQIYLGFYPEGFLATSILSAIIRLQHTPYSYIRWLSAGLAPLFKMEGLVFQSLRTLISSLGSKAIDPNRIYITGFSFGGCAAFEMVCFYPRVFAAGLPISSVESEYILPTDIAVNLWCIENRMTISKERESLYQRMKERVANTGGDFRVSFYPKPNHDAWTAAWKEDALWDWLFSKHRSANRNTTKVNQPNPFHTYKCESNISPKANQFAPRYGADGLKGTCFKADNAKNGSWWQLTSSDMLSGTITLIMGKAKDVATYPHCVIEASRDSFHWRRITNTNIHSDKTIFTLQEPVLHIRIRYTGTKPQMFIIREVSVANQPTVTATSYLHRQTRNMV